MRIISQNPSTILTEVLYVKKIFERKKSSKGFYAALGISAVMIGSACYFAYDQGEKLTEKFTAENSVSTPEAAVDRQVKNIPKNTTPAYKSTTPPVTRAVTTAPMAETAPPMVTIPAADIVTESVESVNTEADSAPAGVTKMENVKAPLNDMSEIVGVFSGGDLVKSPTTGSWQTHNGTDIAAEVGSEVYAVSNGEISEITDDPIWGVTVTLNHHNGFTTRYCGLSRGLNVQQGDTLLSGDLIGTVGNTADIESSLDPHLHIEILHNGSYIDPMSELLK